MYKSGSATTIHIEKHMSGPTITVLQSEIQNFCCIYCYYVLVELYTSSSAKIIHIERHMSGPTTTRPQF